MCSTNMWVYIYENIFLLWGLTHVTHTTIININMWTNSINHKWWMVLHMITNCSTRSHNELFPFSLFSLSSSSFVLERVMTRSFPDCLSYLVSSVSLLSPSLVAPLETSSVKTWRTSAASWVSPSAPLVPALIHLSPLAASWGSGSLHLSHALIWFHQGGPPVHEKYGYYLTLVNTQYLQDGMFLSCMLASGRGYERYANIFPNTARSVATLCLLSSITFPLTSVISWEEGKVR